MNATTRLTHPARVERRRLIAEAVKSGMGYAQAARMFAVSIRTAQYACQEFEVRPNEQHATYTASR